MLIWPRGINRRILILTLCSVFGACLITGLLAVFTMMSSTKNNVLNYNRELAISEANMINNFLLDSVYQINAMAEVKDLSNQDSGVRNKALTRIYEETTKFNGVSLINNKGEITSFYPGFSNIIGQSLSSRDYVKYVLQKGDTYVSKPYYTLTKKWVFVVAAPLKDDKGETIGVISGSIDLFHNKSLNNLRDDINLDKQGYSYIVSSEGYYISHPDKNLIMRKAVQSDLISAKPILGLMGSENVKDSQGNKYLAGYAPVQLTGWGVVVQTPEKQAYASINNMQYTLVFFILLVGILDLVLALKFAKKITLPLSSLVQASKEVTEGNYTTKVEVKSNDEIGILGNSFNKMVDSIREMRNDILNKKSQLEIINHELQIMANTDGLTKLYNHRYFQERLENEIKEASNNGKLLSLLMLDIDHFKHYNDYLGHQAGDQLLKDLSNILKNNIRELDIIARYGGEEFTLILPGVDTDEAMKTAERIRRLVEECEFPGREQQPGGHVTVSIGIASFPKNATNKEELIKLADDALYKAKSSTRNQVVLYVSVLDDLKEELNSSEAELLNTIKMLLRIINAKDKYTSEHSERVGTYAMKIAEELSLSYEDIHNIKIGAYLHDIGKIEINREILTKDSKLTEAEYDVIKMHPIWGADIVKSVDVLLPTVPLILYHHERYDGQGYPQGLKGEQIPFLARIMAVADSYDAMTSNRPYRKGMSLMAAEEELKRFAGTQFDPQIVEALIKALNK